MHKRAGAQGWDRQPPGVCGLFVSYYSHSPAQQRVCLCLCVDASVSKVAGPSWQEALIADADRMVALLSTFTSTKQSLCNHRG